MSEEGLQAYRQRLDGAAISTYALCMMVVPAKLWCRWKLGGVGNLGWEDVLSVVTLALVNAFFYENMVGLRPYLGRHVGTDVTLEEVGFFLQWLFSASLTYLWCIAFIKFTVLAFYWRIFSVAARIPITIVTMSVFAWLVGLFFVAIFSCNPIRAQWDLVAAATAQCLPQRAIYLGGSIPNVIVDFVLVLMPMPYLFRLNVSIAQRAILSGLFALGIFVAIVSIVRLTIVMAIPPSDQDVTYAIKDFMLWSMVEVNIGLVCSCLPSLKPMLRMVGLDKIFSSIRGSKGTPAGIGPDGTAKNPSAVLGSSEASRPRAKKPGLFTSMAGLDKIDSDEENFELANNAAGHSWAKNTTDVKIRVGRETPDMDNQSGTTSQNDDNEISVHTR